MSPFDDFVKDLFILYWKGRTAQRNKDLGSTGSFPRESPELSEFKARSIFQVFHVGMGYEAIGPSPSAFPVHKLGVKWEVDHLGECLRPTVILTFEGRR